MAEPQVIYDQEYFPSGWFDTTGQTLPAWWDRDLASGTPGSPPVVIRLDFVEPGFVDNEVLPDGNVIYPLDGGEGTPFPAPPIGPDHMPPGFTPTSGVWVWLVAEYFKDDDLFFVPMSVRALQPPDKYLKNEVIRIR